jgi:hypothetical protein
MMHLQMPATRAREASARGLAPGGPMALIWRYVPGELARPMVANGAVESRAHMHAR